MIEDKLVKILPYLHNSKCLVASSNGKGFIANLDDILTSQKKGKQLFNLKNNDFLIKVIKCNHDHLACVNSDGKLLIFEVKSLPNLNKGSGVQLQKIKGNNQLIDIKDFNISEGIYWYKGSKKRILNDVKFWVGQRAQSGKKVPKYFNKNFKFFN